MILEKLVVGSYGSNCYIVGDEAAGEGIIIDPGAEGDRILQTVSARKLNIKLIVLTHGHMDHLGALREVREGTKAGVAIHQTEAESPHGRFGFMYGAASTDTTSVISRKLNDGDEIKVGNLNFSVIHTPGHTPGGISLLGNGVVFTGDTLFRFGIGRYDMPGSSGSQLAESLRRLLELPDETKVYPGHGAETTIGAERRGNPFLRDL